MSALLSAPGTCRVDYLRKDLEIRNGEIAVTSGLGGIFPPGLVVGRVVRMTPDETGLYQQGEIEPTADLGRLQRVLVVTAK